MDAGVPLARPVAGIAMGLIKEERALCVCRTFLVMKITSVTWTLKCWYEDGVTCSADGHQDHIDHRRNHADLRLSRLKKARLHILDEMSKALSNSRDSVSGNAPRVTAMQINPEKIRDIIGPGGKIIREICETTGVKIDVEDDGSVRIAAVDAEAGDRAAAWIRDIVAEPEVGVVYDGKVVKTVDFGAFVNFLGPRDGLVHISEMAEGRVEKVSDVVNEGDDVKVKLIGIDDRGKVKLSMRVVNQETGEDITEEVGERKKRT